MSGQSQFKRNIPPPPPARRYMRKTFPVQLTGPASDIPRIIGMLRVILGWRRQVRDDIPNGTQLTGRFQHRLFRNKAFENTRHQKPFPPLRQAIIRCTGEIREYIMLTRMFPYGLDKRPTPLLPEHPHILENEGPRFGFPGKPCKLQHQKIAIILKQMHPRVFVVKTSGRAVHRPKYQVPRIQARPVSEIAHHQFRLHQ